jgi:hypothetical protein
MESVEIAKELESLPDEIIARILIHTFDYEICNLTGDRAFVYKIANIVINRRFTDILREQIIPDCVRDMPVEFADRVPQEYTKYVHRLFINSMHPINLKRFTSLETLYMKIRRDITDDQITSTRLRTLRVYGCSITDTIVKKLSNLIDLGFCDCLGITSDCLSTLTNLLWLSIGSNLLDSHPKEMYIPSLNTLTDLRTLILTSTHVDRLTPNIMLLNVENSHINALEIALLTNLRKLELCSTIGEPVDLSELSELKTLVLNSTIIRGNLSKLCWLRSLTVVNTPSFTNRHLMELTNLDKLVIENMPAIEHLPNLSSLDNLYCLIIFGTSITDQQLQQLSKLTNLRHLSLGRTQGLEIEILSFEALTNLNKLVLMNVHIEQLPSNIIYLSISISHINSANIATLTRLQSLNLSHTISDAIELNNLIDLRELFLNSVEINSNLALLTRLDTLRMLNIINMINMSLNLTSLTRLDLGNMPGVWNVSNLINLQHLTIQHVDVPDEDLRGLTKLTNLERLQ